MGFQWFRGSAEGDAHLLLSRRPARHGVCGTATLLNERSVQLDTIIYLASPYYTMFLHLFIFSHLTNTFIPFTLQPPKQHHAYGAEFPWKFDMTEKAYILEGSATLTPDDPEK